MLERVQNMSVRIAEIKPLFEKATKSKGRSFTLIFYVISDFSKNRKIDSGLVYEYLMRLKWLYTYAHSMNMSFSIN